MRPVCISSLAPKPPGTRGLARTIGLSSPTNGATICFDLLHLADGVVEAGAFGAIDDDLERAAVLGRRQFRRQHREQRRSWPASAASITTPNIQVRTDVPVQHPAVAGRQRAPGWRLIQPLQTARPLLRMRRISLEAIIGVSVSATKAEIATAPASATASSRNRRPVLPSRKPTGRNTATSTAVVAITANATCAVPRRAATSGGSPRSTRRCTFSTTTMASSTTSPMHSTSASRVSRLIEKPKAYSAMKAATRHTGTVTAGISAARKLPRNSQITISTSTIASTSVS